MRVARAHWLDRLSFVLLVAALLGLLVLLATACGPPALKEGDVVSHRFDGAHNRHWMEQQYVGESCSGTGSKRTCTPNYIYVQRSEWVPDRWYVTITDGERKSERQVSESMFTEWQDGEHVVIE